MYKIKEISVDLGITPQAIYNQKNNLIKKGYMLKNADNDWEITSDGYDFLKANRKKRIKQNQSTLIAEENIQKAFKIYEERVNELLGQVKYFKELYEHERAEKDKILNKLING